MWFATMGMMNFAQRARRFCECGVTCAKGPRLRRIPALPHVRMSEFPNIIVSCHGAQEGRARAPRASPLDCADRCAPCDTGPEADS